MIIFIFIRTTFVQMKERRKELVDTRKIMNDKMAPVITQQHSNESAT